MRTKLIGYSLSAGLRLALAFLFLMVAFHPGDASAKVARAGTDAVLHNQTSITPLADPVADLFVEKLIGRVSQRSVMAYAAGLTGQQPVMVNGILYTITTRVTGSGDLEIARKYIIGRLQSLGLQIQIYRDKNIQGSEQYRTVIGLQPGNPPGGCIILIGAHLDNVEGTPGADDNASGVTGVITAADILSPFRFVCDIQYVFFGGEEQAGMLGSEQYATYLDNNNKPVWATLILDMIGYNSDDYHAIEIHTRPGNRDEELLADRFHTVVQDYEINLQPEIKPDEFYFSDSTSFWNHDFPTLLATEDFDRDFDWPNYHKGSDLPGTLDKVFFTNYIRAAVGTMARLAQPAPTGTLVGTATSSESGAALEGIAVWAQFGGLSWMTTTESGGNYSMQLPPGVYLVSASAPYYSPEFDSQVSISSSQESRRDFALGPGIPVFMPVVYGSQE